MYGAMDVDLALGVSVGDNIEVLVAVGEQPCAQVLLSVGLALIVLVGVAVLVGVEVGVAVSVRVWLNVTVAAPVVLRGDVAACSGASWKPTVLGLFEGPPKFWNDCET